MFVTVSNFVKSPKLIDTLDILFNTTSDYYYKNTTNLFGGSFVDGNVVSIDNNRTNQTIADDKELFRRDHVFDRTDVRVIFITMYSLVFCCCFLG